MNNEKIMKRYLLFRGDDYYPMGGMYDFEGDFDSVSEAMIKLNDLSYDWFHIYDLEEKRIIRRE